MSNNSNENTEQSTDLFILLEKLKDSLDHLGLLTFRFFRFFVKNIFIILGILIFGGIAGYFIDKYKGNRYRNEIIVTANFGSVDYLYKKIKDNEYKGDPVQFAEIKPITNVYAFIKERYQNLEMAKYMSDNSIKFERYQPNENIENFHRYHVLTIYSNKEDLNGDVIDNFLEMFNQDAHFLDRKKVGELALEKSIQEYNHSIKNINQILDKLGNNEPKESDLSVTTYSELFQLLNVKKSMIEELNNFKYQQLEQSKVIFDTSRITNIIDNKIKYIYVFPIVLLSLFFVFIFLKNSYNRYSEMDKKKQYDAVNR